MREKNSKNSKNLNVSREAANQSLARHDVNKNKKTKNNSILRLGAFGPSNHNGGFKVIFKGGMS